MPSTSSTLMFLTIASLAATGCRDRNSPSFTKFAHVGSSQLLSTPLGRLGLQDSGIDHALGRDLSICVQRYGLNQFSDQALLFEVKLAHALWIKASGYGATDFSRFHFALADDCPGTSSSVIALEQPSLSTQSTQDSIGTFNEAKLTCSARGDNAYGCNSDGGITLGWGTPGSIKYEYFADNPKKWTKVGASSPSMVRLSPFVDWLSLEDGISSNSKLSGEAKTKLTSAYQNLIANGKETQTFNELIEFGNLLGAHGVTMGIDQEFTSIMQKSASAGESFSGRAYRPRQAAFHTLLHEVGHTFGLTHADNPGAGDITGPSATTVFESARNQYITKMATMAYGESYGFLTEDDRLGATSAAASIKAEIATHQ